MAIALAVCLPGAAAVYCQGNRLTWDAGYGDCTTYASGESNNGYCSQDSIGGLSAAQVCVECGECYAQTSSPPPPSPSPPPPPPSPSPPPPPSSYYYYSFPPPPSPSPPIRYLSGSSSEGVDPLILALAFIIAVPITLGIVWIIVRYQQNKKYGWVGSHEVGTSIPPPDAPAGGIWVENDECDPANVIGGLFAFSTLAYGLIIGIIVIVVFCSGCCGTIRPKTVYKVDGVTYYPNGALKDGTGRDVELGKATPDDDEVHQTNPDSQDLSASA